MYCKHVALVHPFIGRKRVASLMPKKLIVPHFLYFYQISLMSCVKQREEIGWREKGSRLKAERDFSFLLSSLFSSYSWNE